MIICVCHNVSDRAIAREAGGGCATFAQLQDELGVGTGCGACVEYAQKTFQQHACGGPARQMLRDAEAGCSQSPSGVRQAATA